MKNIKSGDDTITILRDINLTVKQGEKIAIVGASGSGKTTLLSIVAGLLLPTSGHVYYRDQAINLLNEDARTRLRGHEMGFIFQNYQLLPALTAIENVTLPLELQFQTFKEAQVKAVDWLKKVGLKHRLYHYPNQLSGGEAQRVAIARAFVHQPRLILADEMTGNLDAATGREVINVLLKIKHSEEFSMIIVTHDESLSKLCDKVYMLKDGKLHLVV